MKTLHVIESLGRGGAEQALVNLLPALREHEFESEVLALRGPLDLRDELEAAGIRVHQLDRFPKWRLNEGARAVRDAAGRTGASLVHGHLYFAGLYAGVARTGPGGLPTAVTFHNLAYAPGCNHSRAKTALRKRINRHVLRRGIDRAIAVSDGVARHYEEHLGLRGITTIPNAVGPEWLRRPERVRPEGAPTFVCVGRLVHEKGLFDLIEAFAALPPTYARPLLQIIGDGPQHAALEERVQALSLEERVELTGRLSNGEVMARLEQADAAVFPSHYEGFGIAAAEAMAVGLPVIVTAVGGLLEVARADETALVVPARDPGALADAMARLANDPTLRQRLGRAARADVLQRFAPATVARDQARLYASLVGAAAA